MSNRSLPIESIGDLVTNKVPTVSEQQTVKEVMELLAREEWLSISVIYVTNESHELQGVIPLTKLVSANQSVLCKDLMEKPQAVLSEHDDQEKAVIEAIKYDLKSVPVADKEGKFKGAVTADKIIDILHEEHLEDFLRSSGIRGRGARILDLMSANFLDLIKSRLPWLIVGLSIGLIGSFIVSFFEEPVRKNISLVFFMPVVAYMSGAIGTQTETVFIRSLTYLKINIFQYIFKELILGMVFGLVIGLITGTVAYFISGSIAVSTVITLSLFISMSVATIMGVLVPLFLKYLKKDPAVGSGPFITSLQDLISLTIYFSIAYLLLP